MSQNLKINYPIFEWGSRTYVMGILNITPDSFSGDGLLPSPPSSGEEFPLPPISKIGVASVLEQTRRFMAAGVSILDVGGESTRPGAVTVSAEEEVARVIPVIRALADEFPGFPISIDTYKAEVAQRAIMAGATVVNDVWGLWADPEMRAVVARYGVLIVLMHNRSKPANAEVEARLGGRYVGVQYDNLIEDVKRELMECVALAHAAGIQDKNIILDPGIGFGKTVSQNLELLNRLNEIKTLGYPVLLGSSRKSFIGYTLNLPPDQRVEGTAATIAVGIARGADIVRVHDVEVMVRVTKMTDAIVRASV